MLSSKVTSKGQITIPHSIREKLNLISGSKLKFLLKENYIIVLPVNGSLQSLKGILVEKSDQKLSCEGMNNIIKAQYDRY